MLVLAEVPLCGGYALGDFFRTRAALSPGHGVNKPAMIEVVHDDMTGLKAALVRKNLPKSIATAKGHLRQDQQNI